MEATAQDVLSGKISKRSPSEAVQDNLLGEKPMESKRKKGAYFKVTIPSQSMSDDEVKQKVQDAMEMGYSMKEIKNAVKMMHGEKAADILRAFNMEDDEEDPESKGEGMDMEMNMPKKGME